MLNSLFNSLLPKMRLKMISCRQVATPPHDMNFYPTNAENHPSAAPCFSLESLISLTFSRAEPEPITQGISTVHAAPIVHITQRPEHLRQNKKHLPCAFSHNHTATPSFHPWDPLQDGAKRERRNGTGGDTFRVGRVFARKKEQGDLFISGP